MLVQVDPPRGHPFVPCGEPESLRRFSLLIFGVSGLTATTLWSNVKLFLFQTSWIDTESDTWIPGLLRVPRLGAWSSELRIWVRNDEKQRKREKNKKKRASIVCNPQVLPHPLNLKGKGVPFYWWLNHGTPETEAS